MTKTADGVDDRFQLARVALRPRIAGKAAPTHQSVEARAAGRSGGVFAFISTLRLDGDRPRLL